MIIQNFLTISAQNKKLSILFSLCIIYWKIYQNLLLWQLQGKCDSLNDDSPKMSTSQAPEPVNMLAYVAK